MRESPSVCLDTVRRRPEFSGHGAPSPAPNSAATGQDEPTNPVCGYPVGINSTYRTKATWVIDNAKACTAQAANCRATCHRASGPGVTVRPDTPTGDERQEAPPVIIDIEASGFGRGSYPIEIGYYMPEGESFCTLIRPEATWTHWDASAEKVHGIPRELLATKGRPAVEVCLELNRRLRGRRIYCDAWAYDYVWLSLLYDAVDLVPSFELKDMRDLLEDCEQALWHTLRAAVEDRLHLRRHRASGDARALFETLTEARKRCAPDWTA